jgi:hypothetical protein
VVGGTVVTGAGGTVVTGGAVFGVVVGVVTDVQARVQVTEPSPCPNAVAGLMMLTAAVMANVKNVFFMSRFFFLVCVNTRKGLFHTVAACQAGATRVKRP